MSFENLENDEMFKVYNYTEPKEDMSTEELINTYFRENRILLVERYLNEEEWGLLDKEIAVSGFCIFRIWNSRIRTGSYLKRDEETPLFCPRCANESKEGLLQLVSDYPRSI